MISLSSGQRYFLFRGTTAMRKSFDGLCGLVTDSMNLNALSGDVFIFINKSRSRMKLLVWDRSGYVIYYKRLEQGTFEFPVAKEDETDFEIRWEKLILILEGISLESVRHRKRFSQSD
jgi:transposase